MTGRLRPAALLLAATLVSSAAAYQVMRPVIVDFASPLAPPVTARGLFPVEGGFRWTGARAAVAVPGPGPGRAVRVEAVVSAWRPRGAPAPLLRAAAEGATVVAEPGPAPATLTLAATTTASARGDVELRLESETFAPGRGDPRTLGVRLHRVTVAPAGGLLAFGTPPVVPLLWAVAVVQLALWTAYVVGARPARASLVGVSSAATVAAGLALARAWTVGLLPALALAEAAVLALAAVLPARVHAVAATAGESARRAVRAVRALDPKALGATTLLAVAAVTAAYRARPEVVIPMGSGRETAFEEGLGSFDAAEGARFRHAAPGAVLDLRDLGAGPWRVAVTAAAPGAPRPLAVFDAGAGPVEAVVGPDWSVHETAATAPGGWRAGLALTFGGSRRDDLWIREVRVDRGRPWPPLRVVFWVIVTAALVAAAPRAAGLGAAAAVTAGALAVLLEAAALAVDPVAAIPEVTRLAAIAAAGLVLTALSATVAWGGANDEPALPPAALAAGGAGFMAWLATTTAPLYRGGHFVFHSSIAEEIWKGRFLLYYLPYPGSMLSEQAQWGNVIVPHPALYQTVVAPLAALPHAAFYAAEKVFLALLLAAMVWACAGLAARVGPKGAATAAAILMAAMPASYQLLGLGHLMTIFGCWAMTLAVVYVALRWETLGARPNWWRAVLLLALCALAYFAGLLFMLMIVAIAALALWRREPAFVRALVTATAAACAIAFVLYYVNWTWPFLSQSVPRLLGGSGAPSGANAGALPLRLAAAPRKLTYTFGSALVPVLGLGGLLRARRSVERVLLLAWAAVLPVFMALDLSFNFLLKHHYFTMAPVAIGGGVLLATLAERGRWGRAAAVAALVLVVVLGARVGLDAALGRIP